MLNWTPLLIATFIASALSARIGAQASADLFVFSSGDRCGYIDQARSGLSPSFDACRDFSEGFAPVLVHDNWGFIDREGKIVIAPKFGDARWSFSEGLAAVKFGSKWGYINVRGDFAIPPRFE